MYMGMPSGTRDITSTSNRYDRVRPGDIARETAATRRRYQPYLPRNSTFVGGPKNSGENPGFAGTFAGGFGAGNSSSSG